MNIFQKVVITSLSLTFLTSGSVKASINEEHKVLVNSLETIGVDFVLNDVDLCDPEDEVAGLYSPRHNVLVVCQDNRFTMSGKEVEWTENDYDTLRHESHHVLQDCVTGLDNHTMDKYFAGVSHGEFVRSILTIDQINKIVEIYKENGSSREAIANELEAFAVALKTSPSVIAQQLETLCLSE